MKKNILALLISILCLLSFSVSLEAGRNIDITITPDKAEDYVIEEKATFDIEMFRRNKPANIKLKQIEATFPTEDVPVTLTKVSKGKFKYISEEFEETGEKTLSLAVRSYGAVKKIEMFERMKERLEKRIEKLEERKENTNNERLKRILDRLIAKYQRSIQRIEAKIEKTREKGIIGEASLTINVIPIAPPPEVPESGHIYGNVYDSVTNLAIYEVIIIVEGIEGGVSTNEEGRFRFPISEFEGDFRDAGLLIQKEGYISVARNISVVSERDVSVGDIYLKEVDPVVTEITPAGGEATDSTETVKITFPPDAVSETVDIVITPYEEEKEIPQELPLATNAIIGINVEAEGAVLTQPVTVELPNDKGFAPGTLIPIGSYDEEIEEWVHETFAVVSADGTKIIYQTTHFSDQAAGLPTAPGEDGAAQSSHGDGNNTDADGCQTAKGPGSRVGFKVGNLIIEHKLPAVKYLGKTESLNFFYDTETVNPGSKISLKLRGPSGERPIPETYGFNISIGNEKRHVVFDAQPGWYVQSFLFNGKDGDGNLLPTGSYPYSASTSNDYNSFYCLTDEFGGPPIASTGIPTEKPVPLPMVVPGRVEIQNEINSPFGAGWSIEGIQRMYFDPDGIIAIATIKAGMDIFAAGKEVAKGFGTPGYMAISPTGDIIVTDPLIAQMDDVEPSHEVITAARIKPDGTKEAILTEAEAQRPSGVVYDQFGNLYIANAMFPKYDASGNPIPGTFPTILVIDPLGGTTELPCPAARPGALAIDALNNLYVADLIMGRICKITPFGQVSIFAKGFNLPGEMAFDASGNLYVANGLKSGISRITPSGEKTVILRDIKKAGGLAILPDGRILVTGIEKGVIYRIDPVAETYEIIASGFMHPAGIAIKGNEIIVANASHGVVTKIGIDGEIKGYTGPSTDYSTLTKNIAEETYTRKDKYGANTIFNKEGLQIKKIDRNNNITTYAYIDANGDSKVEELSAITLPTGQNYTFVYDGSGKLSSITDPANRVTQFAIDGENNLTQITNPDGTARQFTYNSEEHLLVSKTDERGNTTDYIYDENGKISEVRLPGQDNPVHNYAPSIVEGNINDLQEGTGTEDNPAPAVMLDTLTDGYTDPSGNQTLYKTDRYGRIIEQTDALGNLTKTDRDREGKTRKITRANGSIVEMSYDVKGNLLTSTNKAIDAITTFTYEPDFNQVVSITNPEGNSTQYEYDVQGNLVKIIDAESNETTMSYNAKGLLTSTTDAKGNTTTCIYDDKGNLTKITDALNNETSFTYDDAGNMVSTTDVKDNVTVFEYDQMSRLLKLTDSQGNITSYDYDQAGNCTKVIDPKGNATAYEYDEMNQLTSAINAKGDITTYTYDENGNRTSVTDANNNTTTYAYNEINQLIKATDSLNKITSYAYDEMGNMTSTTDANGNTTNCAYDLLSRLIQTIYSDTTYEQYTYDANSNLLSKRTRKGDVITYSYDDLNRLDIKTYPNAATVDYSYDITSRLTSVIASDSEAISYTYDNLNRVTQVTSQGKTIDYEYDNTGNRTKLIYPDSSYITYDYDNLNRLTTIKDDTTTIIASYSYDTLSRRTQANYANNTQSIYDYDSVNRLVSLANKINAGVDISTFAYTYDNVGNRLTMTKNSQAYSYTYDNIYQLTNANYPDGYNYDDTAFNYDGLGNRTSIVNGGTTNYTSNNLNQYITVGTSALNYDNNGNLINDGTWTFGYDYENRLISATNGTINVSYTYDALGRRIQKDVGGVITKYIYDGDQVIAEYDNSGTLLRKFVYGSGIDEPILLDDGANKYYYNFDGLGSVSEITDSTGVVIEKYEYDVYGRTIIKDGSDNVLTKSAIKNPYAFTGRRLDNETGLYYYRSRYYSPTLGRFIQTDPIGYVGGINLYTYVGNNPINILDPWGAKPGDKYQTQDEAGKEACNDIYNNSVKEGREYGGYIYKNKDGTYSYTPPSKGGKDWVNPGPKPSNATADYHSHGAPDPGYDNESFSDVDKRDNERTGLTGYLVTPSGKIKKYDPSTQNPNEKGTETGEVDGAKEKSNGGDKC